ncbi:hypothetical protein B0G81_7831 [Paraburkholderia sp. BL6665CI2N2]|uniref:hypothetical protein n=1 Tax=Paraburkholderia sp. BL6665CI2N2 TaxID=1938806 RepID=UPI0010652338|nr:hypothetical protein [Paraburkholderia sp. BL6665CI2N2]TDY16732.1 hypothetical protein B0G81_7831 [Paraburkholderia sp. BL6665CI2N2]
MSGKYKDVASYIYPVYEYFGSMSECAPFEAPNNQPELEPYFKKVLEFVSDQKKTFEIKGKKLFEIMFDLDVKLNAHWDSYTKSSEIVVTKLGEVIKKLKPNTVYVNKDVGIIVSNLKIAVESIENMKNDLKSSGNNFIMSANALVDRMKADLAPLSSACDVLDAKYAGRSDADKVDFGKLKTALSDAQSAVAKAEQNLANAEADERWTLVKLTGVVVIGVVVLGAIAIFPASAGAIVPVALGLYVKGADAVEDWNHVREANDEVKSRFKAYNSVFEKYNKYGLYIFVNSWLNVGNSTKNNVASAKEQFAQFQDNFESNLGKVSSDIDTIREIVGNDENKITALSSRQIGKLSDAFNNLKAIIEFESVKHAYHSDDGKKVCISYDPPVKYEGIQSHSV